MKNWSLLKRSLVMGALFTVFYLVLILQRDGMLNTSVFLELLMGYVFFVLFYYLFGRFIRPLIKPGK